MHLYRYDNTFEGFLTLVFDAYARRAFPDRIVREDDHLLFDTDAHTVVTDSMRAQRVWTGLRKALSPAACSTLPVVFLSELPGVEMLLFRYIRRAFADSRSPELDFGDPDVLEISKIYKKVTREAEHIRMFVRFQKTADGIFFAPVEPRCNVLPLVAGFFTDRFADQPWIVYDIRRHYGLYYDLHDTTEITFNNLDFDLATGKLHDRQAAEDEKYFQQLWESYFKSISIKERANPRLHRQLLPKRFWKFLPEKQ
jgi:probable DNA metabolism protein